MYSGQLVSSLGVHFNKIGEDGGGGGGGGSAEETGFIVSEPASVFALCPL